MARIVLPLYRPRYIPTGEEVAVFETSKGTIKAHLLGKECPQTVGSFVELAQKGFYDVLNFYGRVEGDVVVGGCPITRPLNPHRVRMAVREQLRGVHPGIGNCGYRIVDEWEGNPLNHHVLGSLSLTHRMEPDSGCCQFFFSLVPRPDYDEKFTMFGTVVEGIEVVQQLQLGDPIERVFIEGAHELPCDDEEILEADRIQQEDADAAVQEATAAARESAESELSDEAFERICSQTRDAIIDDELHQQALAIAGLRRMMAKKKTM